MPALLASTLSLAREAVAASSDDRSAWVALRVFCGYRLVLALALAGSHLAAVGLLGLGGTTPARADPILASYGLAAVLLLALALLRRPSVDAQVSVAVAVDVAMVAGLQHVTADRLGLELLLLISIAAAALVARGRYALFQAAIATVGLLGEQAFRVLHQSAPASDFVQAGLTSAAYFATAGVSWVLALYARSSEALARARAEEVAALSRVNELVVRDMPQGLLVVDREGRVRTRNAAAERLLGPASAEPRPRLADFAPAVDQHLQAWRAGRGAAVTPPLPGQSGTPERVATFLDPGLDRAGLVVILVEDLGRLNEQARQVKLAALGRLTASIAHEIRNPLSSINQAAELMAETAGAAGGQSRLLSIIRGNVDRLDRIVTEVLDINRRTRGEPEAVELGPALRQFAAAFCDAEHLSRDRLRVEGAGDTGLRALVDRQHLERVLWNLARNAWRHGKGEPGSVRLSAGRGAQPGTLAITVADDGPGLTAEARERLFEPFYTTDTRGVGLGLFIARELCEGNGGTLEALEGAPGARFRVTLRQA